MFGQKFSLVKTAKALIILATAGAALVLNPRAAAAQAVSIPTATGFTYQQNFNSLPASGSVTFQNGVTLPGWHLPTNGTVVTADNGSKSTNGMYSYGTTGAADRAFGNINGGTYQLVMKNNTGGTVNNFKISYRTELWYKRTGNIKDIQFHYTVAPAITPTGNYPETYVAELRGEINSSTLSTMINGNVEFTQNSFTIENIDLPAGYEIRFSWVGQKTNWGLAIDDVVITPENVARKDYYNKNLTDVTALSNWGTNKDGSGAQPVSFDGAGQHFNIINYNANSTFSLPQNWLISGVGATVVLGNNTTPVTFELTGGQTFTGAPIDLTNYATLAVDVPKMPTLGQVSNLSTIIFRKNAPATIEAPSTFGTVILNTAKNMRFNKKVKINGRLELQNAKLELGDHDLELNEAAAIVNSSVSNYVVLNGSGRLRKAIKAGAAEVTLPVGNTTYNPVKIKLAAGSQDDVFSVGLLEGVYGTYTNDLPALATALQTNTVNKTWVVSEDVKGGSDIALTLTWNATDVLPGFNPARCHVKHFENGVWDTDLAAAATLAGNTYSVTRTGIQSFSPFTVSSEGPTVLPVEVLLLRVKPTGNNTVNVSWATATEKNNDYFLLEKSRDGKNFTQIAQLKGQGTTGNRTNYTFTDNNAAAGTIYYRLRQVDMDGIGKYLPVRSVTVPGVQKLGLNLYPNPAQGSQVTLQVLGLAYGEEAKLLVTDIMGTPYVQKIVNAQKPVILAAGELKAGTYLVKVVSKTGAQTQKLVIH